MMNKHRNNRAHSESTSKQTQDTASTHALDSISGAQSVSADTSGKESEEQKEWDEDEDEDDEETDLPYYSPVIPIADRSLLNQLKHPKRV